MSGLAPPTGSTFGPTAWRAVEQGRIDLFAEATDDPQWIHVDVERASAGPFGGTVAHGFLTLSLCVPMLYEALPAIEGTLVNVGVDRVRFPAPLPSGARIRATFAVTAVGVAAGGERATIEATVEREGSERPVCVATLVLLFLP